jgi:hypothetical protein
MVGLHAQQLSTLAASSSEPWTYAKPSGHVKRSPAALDCAHVKLGGAGEGDAAGRGVGEGEAAGSGGLGDGELAGGVGPACKTM